MVVRMSWMNVEKINELYLFIYLFKDLFIYFNIYLMI